MFVFRSVLIFTNSISKLLPDRKTWHRCHVLSSWCLSYLPLEVWRGSESAGRSDWGMCSFCRVVGCRGCPQNKPENKQRMTKTNMWKFSLFIPVLNNLAENQFGIYTWLVNICVFETSFSLPTSVRFRSCNVSNMP